MDARYDECDVVVFTTHERAGYFTPVLGENIDLRLDPRQGPRLCEHLHNIVLAGGRLVVLDEAFFMDIDDLAMGLERFLIDDECSGSLRIIVVCTKRRAGDLLLAFLVMYCGISDIIYGKEGIGVSIHLSQMLKRDSSKKDVVELIEAGRWENIKHCGKRRTEDESELLDAEERYKAQMTIILDEATLKLSDDTICKVKLEKRYPI